MRRELLIGAAAAAAVVAIGAIYLAAGREPGASMQGSQPASALLVRDGDMVEATGRVIAAPGAPVKFCAPAPEALGASDGPPDCVFWIQARGVDLDALADRKLTDGVVVGRAALRGTWRARVLTVTRQTPPLAPTTVPMPLPDEPPCEPPAGGWQRTSDFDSRALHDYLERHPDQFAAPWMAWPEGPPGGDTAAPGFLTKPAVVVVEVVSGDVDRARAELGRVFTGNLCIARAAPDARSSAEVNRNAAAMSSRVQPLMNDRTNGIYSAGDDPSGKYHVDFVVLDQRLLDAFAPVGLDNLILDPWIRPVPPDAAAKSPTTPADTTR